MTQITTALGAAILALTAGNSAHGASAPVIQSYATAVADDPGGNVTLYVTATGDPTPTYRWQRLGTDIAGADGASLTLSRIQPSNTGVYSVVVANSAGTRTASAIVGLLANAKVVGAGDELDPLNIRHPNGNVFDQVLLTGTHEAIKADAGQVTRTSFIDLDGDIVQIEFAGAGTLSLVLASPTGPAAPEKYNQPNVQYMKGHAGIVIAGANETTNVSVFTVGRATAFDPTNKYDFLKDPSSTNNPANNGSSLFEGHGATTYDGVADLAFIAIMSANGHFGGVRAANASFFASKGHTGVYAPNVRFTGPVRVGDISAFDDAQPVLLLGSATDVRVTGGDLHQDNGEAVQVSGMEELRFVAGSDSHGRALAARQNRAVLMQNGQDVTSKIVVNP